MTERVSFEVETATAAEAREVAREMGLEVAELARSAFEAYLDGAREARALDLDEDEPGE